VISPTELLWALIGLILTIGGTFIEAFTTNAPWNWGHQGLQAHSLEVNYQIGAVLLVGCMGGRNAGAISQIAYLLLGLTWLNIFSQGGGIGYVVHPSFGYLLGFIPGAWVCGWLAFRLPVRLETLLFSCLGGLLTIHVTGLLYLIAGYRLGWLHNLAQSFWQMAITYSLALLPGQLAIACTVTVLALVLRHLMFY